MKTVAIIPAFNEGSTIGDVIKGTSQFVDEIIVINDGNTDNTIDAAKIAGATIIDNIVNRGLGRTIKRGYDEALKRGADIIVQIDADGQYDPQEIPELAYEVGKKHSHSFFEDQALILKTPDHF